MTTPGPIAAALHVLRVERVQCRIVVTSARRHGRTTRKRVLGWLMFAVWRTVLPAAVAFAAWQRTMVPSDQAISVWAYVAVMAALLGSGHTFQSSALSFAAREVLFLPSKAAVLTARFVHALPLLAFIGGAWALAVWLCLREEQAEQPGTVIVCCVVAALAPLAWNVGAALQRLVAPGAPSVATPACLLAVCGVYLLDPLHWAGGDYLRWVELGAVLMLAAMLAAGLVYGLVRTSRAGVRALWLELVRAPRVLVLAILLLPPIAWRDGAWLSIVAAVGVGSLAVLLPFAVRQLLVAVNGAEAETRGGAIDRVGDHERPHDTRAPRSPVRAEHHGRSPWRATWRLHWLQHGVAWADLRRPWRLLPFVARHGFGFGCVAFAVCMGDEHFPPAFLVAVLFVPVSATAMSRERMHLLGMDLREQARHGMNIALCTVAAPCLLGGALVATVFGWTEHRALVVMAFAAVFVMRIGWRGLLPRPELASANGALVVGLLLITSWWIAALLLPVVPTDINPEVARRVLGDEGARELMTKTVPVQWPIVAGVAVVATFGLVRRIMLWREPELLAELIAERERESQPAT